MSENANENAADPKNSPLVESEVEKDEEYEPETMDAYFKQRKFETQVHARINAATIAAQIPFNPSEPVSDQLITARFDTVYNWILQDQSPSTD